MTWDLSYDDVQTIIKLLDASSLEEFQLETSSLKLTVRKKAAAGNSSVAAAPPISTAGPDSVAAPAPVTSVDGTVRQTQLNEPPPLAPGQVEITAPMLGTFYRAPAPGAAPFVEIGGSVRKGDTLCIIDVMKLMNTIAANVSGCVVAICADDATLVQFGQRLMVIEPES